MYIEDASLNTPSTIPSGNKKKGMSSKTRILLIVIGCICAITIGAACAYVGTAMSYENKFLPNTYIQTANVSDMDVTEAISTVTRTFDDSSVTIVEDGKDDVTFTGEELGLKPVVGSIDDLLAEQDKWSWLGCALGERNEKTVGVQYDSQLIISKVNELECVNPDKRTAAQDATIEYDEDNGQFVAIDGESGSLVDKDALMNAISQMIVNGGGEIRVEDYYAHPQYGADSDEVLDAVSEANRIISKKITYNIDMIDDAETLTKDQIASFLTVNGEMKVSVDEEAVKAWLREVGQEYDTVGDEIRYTTAYGKEAVLPTGVIGWETDEAAMLPVVVENLIGEEQDVDQDFLYQKEGLWAKGGTPDFGNKYVDIDLNDQRVRLIENGEVIYDLVTVTGSNDGRHNTPEGAWEIDFKSAPYLMIGSDEDGDGLPDYKTNTECFANFMGGCALHEMSSRGNWSSTAWLHGGGSHGCANLKRDDAWTAYNFVDYGTPVLVHM